MRLDDRGERQSARPFQRHRPARSTYTRRPMGERSPIAWRNLADNGGALFRVPLHEGWIWRVSWLTTSC